MRVGRRVYTFLLGVLAIAILPFGVFAADPVAGGGGSLLLRILQIVWIVVSILSFGVLIYGFVQMRRVRDDLMEFEGSKRIVLISAVALVISLLLLAAVTFLMMRTNQGTSSTTTTPEQTQIQVGFGNPLGPASKIYQHYPNRDQRNVPRNVTVLISFKDEVNLTSLDGGQGVLKNDAISIQRLREDSVAQGDPISAHVQGVDDKKTIKITPDQILGIEGEPSTQYKVTIFPTVQNSQRASMMGGTGSYSWVFYVGTSIDSAPPQVVSVFPAGGTESTARNSLVQITFSKAIDPTTVKSGFFQINDANKQTPLKEGSFSIHNNYRTVLFTPGEACGSNSCNQRIYCLPGNSRIHVRLKAAAVRTPRDASAPNTASTPIDGITDVQGNSLDGGGEGGAKKDGIAQGTKDDDYTYSFMTSSAMDSTIPTITSILPGRNGTRIDRNAPLEIRFSKIMDISSINQSSVIVGKGIGYWLESDLDMTKKQTITKVFHDPFQENTTYSPEVRGEIRDIYQNCFSACTGPLQ